MFRSVSVSNLEESAETKITVVLSDQEPSAQQQPSDSNEVEILEKQREVKDGIGEFIYRPKKVKKLTDDQQQYLEKEFIAPKMPSGDQARFDIARVHLVPGKAFNSGIRSIAMLIILSKNYCI